MKRHCRICIDRWTRLPGGWCWRCLRLLAKHRREAGLVKMPMKELCDVLYGGEYRWRGSKAKRVDL